jgi:hypothetical protein
MKGTIVAEIGISKMLDEPDFTMESYEIVYGFLGATNHFNFFFDPKVADRQIFVMQLSYPI